MNSAETLTAFCKLPTRELIIVDACLSLHNPITNEGPGLSRILEHTGMTISELGGSVNALIEKGLLIESYAPVNKLECNYTALNAQEIVIDAMKNGFSAVMEEMNKSEIAQKITEMQQRTNGSHSIAAEVIDEYLESGIYNDTKMELAFSTLRSELAAALDLPEDCNMIQGEINQLRNEIESIVDQQGHKRKSSVENMDNYVDGDLAKYVDPNIMDDIMNKIIH